MKPSIAAAPSPIEPKRSRSGEWDFAVEIFPSDWATPAQPFWIAGWILSGAGHGAADVRAWYGDKIFLGLCGLPRPEIEQPRLGRAGPPQAGFSFLLQPQSQAHELRLEVCDAQGHWQEFFRHSLSPPARAAATSAPPRELEASEVARLSTRLLVARKEKPNASWDDLADEALCSALALPLNALPNPPFFGRLELPRPVADVKFGLIEVSGWLAHRTERIKRLLAFVAPEAPVVLLQGQQRRDVGEVFGELRDGPNAQFIGYVAVPPQLPQPLSLRLLAELENGEQHLAFNQRFRPQVVVDAPSSLPFFSRITFARATFALWRAARRRQVRRGSAWRTGLREARENFRAEAPFADARPAKRATPVSTVSLRPLEVILVTHNLNREGAPLIALEQAKYLAAQPGWKIRVVSPADGPLAVNFASAGLPVEIVDASAMWQAGSASDFERAIEEFIKRSEAWRTADIVVANTMVSFWAIHVAHHLKKPSLLYGHESASVRRFFSALDSPAVIPKIESAFGLATRVVFSAEAAQGAHLRHQREQNFGVLPGWIDTAAIAAYLAAHSRSALRREKNIPEDTVVFANIGSVCERKGQHFFLDAIERWQRERASENASAPPLLFLLVGATPGPFVDFLRHEITRRGLGEARLIEPVSDPYAFFQLADIFVCTSFEESLPRVVLEAGAFGLPIVATAVHGVPEILDPSDAWLVAPGDVSALVTALKAALDALLRGDRTRPERARQKVLARFAAGSLLAEHAAYIAEIAARKRD